MFEKVKNNSILFQNIALALSIIRKNGWIKLHLTTVGPCTETPIIKEKTTTVKGHYRK